MLLKHPPSPPCPSTLTSPPNPQSRIPAFLPFGNKASKHVDVAFKLLIDKIELVDNEFKLLNIVVDVAFKLLIDNIEFVDNEFKFAFVAYTDKLGVLIIVEL